MMDEEGGGGRDAMALRWMTAREVLAEAEVARATRDAEGRLVGFQRQPVESHVRSIAAALRRGGTVPSPVMVARVSGAGRQGWVVDGQQRPLACVAAGHEGRIPVLEVEVGCHAELRRLFVTVNNARPLPPGLVAEIMAGMDPLPPRLGDATLARLLAEALNHDEGSPLRGLVRQQTNPGGVVRDTALVRGLRASMAHGMLSGLRGQREAVMEEGLSTVSAFLRALRSAFHADFEGHTPATSRLVHACGVVACLHAMDVVHALTGARTDEEFMGPLLTVRGHCRWTSGHWDFGDGTRLPWDGLQAVPSHHALLGTHLERLLRAAVPERRSAA